MPVTPTPRRPRETVTPTGLPDPALIALAGVDHSGKTLACARATKRTDLFPRSLWLTLREGQAHWYGAVGAFEIVRHDGSYRDLLDAVLWATEQPDIDGRAPLIVFDAGTELNEMLNKEQDLLAFRAAAKKAADRPGTPAPDPDETGIAYSQRNAIKERFLAVTEALADYRGPAVITCLMEEVLIVENNKPDKGGRTKLKWQTHKTLYKRADYAIELREPHAQDGYFVRTRDPHCKMIPQGGELHLPGFGSEDYGLAGFIEKMGIDLTPRERITAGARPEAYVDEYTGEALDVVARDVEESRRRRAALSGEPPTSQQLTKEIREAMEAVNPRQALLKIRSGYSPTLLAAARYQGRDGWIDGDTAISRALHIVRERAAPAPPAAAALPPAAPQPAAPAPAQPAAPAPAQPAPAPEPEVLDVVFEIQAQADVLDLPFADYAKALTDQLHLEDLRAAGPEHRITIGEWMVRQRPTVVDILRVLGLDAAADEYANASREDAAPRDLLERMLGALPGDDDGPDDVGTAAAQAAVPAGAGAG